MDTLKNDLERAIPHFDTTSNDIQALASEGRQALRRRRTRIGALLTTGGLAVAGVAMGGVLIGSQGGQHTKDTTAGGGAETVLTQTPSEAVSVEISLAGLHQVADSCGELTVDRESNTLTHGGQTVDASDTANGDGWAAAQYACGPDIVRIVQTDGRGIIGRYPASDNEPLGTWAETNVEQLRR